LCLGWPDIKTKLLPDESFAVIESDVGTRIRHYAHHDLNGNLHTEQLIYVLGAIDQETWLNSKLKIIAKTHLEKHYDRFKTMAMKKGLDAPVNINEASLKELILLPQIGPVLAVKIVEYRNANGMFITTEEIKKIGGIGQGIFYAIQHYISID
jgi:competence ComEA-like helix-hairpin-helix protein